MNTPFPPPERGFATRSTSPLSAPIAIARRCGLQIRAPFARAALAALLLCIPLASRAQHEITAVLVLTNVPAGLSSNLTLNAGTATTRYWTNNTAGTPSTSIQQTNTIAWSRTNLLAHFIAYPAYTAGSSSPTWVVGYSDTNSAALYFTGPTGTNFTLSVNGLWARVSYFTNTFAAATPILNRTNSMSHAARTNAANSIANLLTQPVTNALGETVNLLSNFVSRGASQTLGNKTITNSFITGTILTNASVIAGTNALIRTFVFINGSIIELTNLSGNIGSGSLTNGTFWSNVVNYARFTNGNFNGTVHTLTGGTWSNATLVSPAVSGLVNSGNPIVSDSTGPNAEAYGSGSEASGSSALAVGFSVLASGASSLGVGNAAKATNDYATAVGRSAIAGGDSSTAIGAFTKATNMYQVALGTAAGSDGTMPAPYSVLIGYDTSANWPGDLILGNAANSTTTGGGNGIAAGYLATISATNAIALGGNSASAYQNSVALGAGSATTKSNEVMLGTSSHHVAVPGILQAAGISNLVTTASTNILRGDLSFPRFDISTVAAGHNVIDIGTNIYVRLTGSPGIDWTLGGITSGSIRDGKFLIIENRTGYSVTIQNESGTAPTAAERILTLASSGSITNATLVGDGVMQFVYNGASSRWILLSPDVDVSSTATNAVNTIATNTVNMSTAITALDFLYGITGYVSGGTAKLGVNIAAASGTNGLVQTNGVNLGTAGTINWTTGVTGYLSGAVANLGITATGGGGGVDGSANSNLSYAIGTALTNFTLAASNSVRLVAGLDATNHANAILQSATNYANGTTNASIVRQAELTALSNVLAAVSGTNDASPDMELVGTSPTTSAWMYRSAMRARPPNLTNIVVTGDSLGTTTGGSVNWPFLLTNANPLLRLLTNTCAASQKAATILSNHNLYIEPWASGSASNRLFIIQAGINDLAQGTNAVQLMNVLSEIYTLIKSNGNYLMVVNLTPSGHNTFLGQETNRILFNAMLKTNQQWDYFFDAAAYIPHAAPWYTNDMLHHSNLGKELFARGVIETFDGGLKNPSATRANASDNSGPFIFSGMRDTNNYKALSHLAMFRTAGSPNTGWQNESDDSYFGLTVASGNTRFYALAAADASVDYPADNYLEFNTSSNAVHTSKRFTSSNTVTAVLGFVAPYATASRPAFINAQGVLTNASGTPDGTKFLRDDGVLAVPSGGGGSVGPGALDFATTQFDTNVIVHLKAGALMTNMNFRGSGTNRGALYVDNEVFASDLYASAFTGDFALYSDVTGQILESSTTSGELAALPSRQWGSASLTNLSGNPRVATNITVLSPQSDLEVSENGAGTWQIGKGTNFGMLHVTNFVQVGMDGNAGKVCIVGTNLASASSNMFLVVTNGIVAPSNTVHGSGWALFGKAVTTGKSNQIATSIVGNWLPAAGGMSGTFSMIARTNTESGTVLMSLNSSTLTLEAPVVQASGVMQSPNYRGSGGTSPFTLGHTSGERISTISKKLGVFSEAPTASLHVNAGTNEMGFRVSSPAFTNLVQVTTNGFAATVYAPMTAALGPHWVTNGMSAIWNSNGIATYIRSSVSGSATNTDDVLKIH